MPTTARLLRWGAHYRLGFDVIDAQHENVAARLNDLYAAWQDGAPRGELGKGLGTLIAAVAEHFESEEKMMREHGYPGAATHAAEHEFLVRYVLEFQREFEEGQKNISDPVMRYLKDWLRDHILLSDRRMAEYILTH